MSIKKYFIDDKRPLTPNNAVAAIIKNSSNEFLLQLRDLMSGIFYPGHWGLFGGALEDIDNNPKDGLIRELQEELNIYINKNEILEFTNFTFDFSFAEKGILSRTYYEIILSDKQINSIKLGEGKDFSFFPLEKVLLQKKVVPYDQYALWLYSAKSRLKK